MINLTKKMIFLANKSDLHLHASASLELIIKVFTNTGKNFRTAMKKIETLFILHPPEQIEILLTEWYAYVACNKSEAQHSKDRRQRLYFSTLTKTDIKPSKTIIRLIFVYLQKNKTAILSHNFTRPQGSITSLPEVQKLFYCETIHPFLDLETNSNNNPGDGKRSYTAAQRLWQTGIKSILMSSFFSPEDINTADLQELRVAQLKNKRNQILPIPTIQIAQTLCKRFPKRVSEDVERWVALSIIANDSAAVQYSSYEAIIIDLLKKYSSPFEITLGLAKYRRYGVSSFSCDTLRGYRVDLHIHQDCEIFITAMRAWLSAEKSFIDHQSLEKPKSLRLAFGKLNLYLFVYLPLWLLQNPTTKFKYPATPSKFSGSVHYDCQLPESPERPLSLCELFRAIGYIESNGSQSEFRTFFSYLRDFGSELEGCSGISQPVRSLPASKKYSNVTKNVFTGEQLRQFIAYHNALHAGAEYFLTNSSHVKSLVEKAKLQNSHVDTVDLGFVPIMFYEGKVSYIRRLHPETFHFVTHDHAPYYHPGSVIFSLFLLECGVRGQTLQWLDVETYDRISQRLSRESLQLTTLWLNTDKVHKIPVIILTTMGNLWLLDDQRRWRDFMINEVGVNGFEKKIFYDHEPNSHWGKILPLFVSNPVTGDPFTDGQYTRLWNYHCLNFQTWLKETTTERNPIIGFLPLRKKPAKTFFTWEEWVNKIDPDDVLVVQGSSTNRMYQGDYCPISLRAYATPHGARASFITDMSINLPPEAVALLTGQSLSTIIKYNKGHHLLIDRLEGVFNNRDSAWYLTNSFNPSFSMAETRDMLECSARQGTLPSAIDKLGLYSFPTSNSPREMTGLKLIATDRSLSLGACYTHICPYNFICPQQILQKFGGQKRCAQCPFAVFSTHNLPAIEAHRQKIAEEYQSTSKVFEKYSASREVSLAEISRLQEEVKNAAKDVISWMFVEEVLWAKIELQQEANQETAGRDLIVSDRSTVVQELSRSEYRPDSVEGFLTRLSSVCTHPESMSRDFEYKIDRATRLLMINDGDITGAAMMPSSFPSAVKLAGMIRSNLDFDKLDIDQFVRLINLEDSDWAQTMLSYRLTKSEPRSDE
ncbi:hypothetical protein [Pseudomonas sp. P8_241]|uniref:hypothetical protein n=1 Tax=Pseudomonas sp. P8_241 TaxID=3043445 RepID=UPI002A358C28|nr:hypothetical protein [Pseudomonas sp. P8_241]WPN48386.1 hypothetical protein QMK58_06910 [Pseudomonas sp. P8_241]